MRRFIEIEELKTIQLEILQSVHDFCVKNGIRYSLDSGTLLGAIRHGGYIPWDDDIDIIMPRPDYDKFISRFNGSTNYLRVFSPELDWNFYAPYANVCDMRTTLSEGDNSHRGIEMGVKIDVFPVDGAPSNSKQYNRVLKRIRILNALLTAKRNSFSSIFKKGTSLRIVLSVLKLFGVFYSYSSIQHRIYTLSTKVPFESSEYAAKLSYTWTKNRCPRRTFEDLIDYSFEGRCFKVLRNYDMYLCRMFGDYMKLPPEEQRVSNHEFIAYWKA